MGQASDYAALAILERARKPTGRLIPIAGETEIVASGPGRYPEFRPVAIQEMFSEYHIRHLERWDIGTSYVRVVDHTLELIDNLTKTQEIEDTEARVNNPAGHPWEPTSAPILGVDHTGVGIAVVDLFRSKPIPIPLVAMTITSGTASHARPQADDAYHPWTVPKAELVGPMLVAAQNGRLKISPQLPHADTLGREMQQFRMKLRAGGTISYEHLADRDHDDLVLAVAIAAWIAHKIDQQPPGVYR